MDNRNSVAIPVVDSIDGRTLKFNGGPEDTVKNVGSFSWSGHMTWINAEPSQSPTEPVKTGTMPNGGIFAMDRETFLRLGGYDEGMVPGNEGSQDLEMSFRYFYH